MKVEKGENGEWIYSDMIEFFRERGSTLDNSSAEYIDFLLAGSRRREAFNLDEYYLMTRLALFWSSKMRTKKIANSLTLDTSDFGSITFEEHHPIAVLFQRAFLEDAIKLFGESPKKEEDFLVLKNEIQEIVDDLKRRKRNNQKSHTTFKERQQRKIINRKLFDLNEFLRKNWGGILNSENKRFLLIYDLTEAYKLGLWEHEDSVSDKKKAGAVRDRIKSTEKSDKNCL